MHRTESISAVIRPQFVGARGILCALSIAACASVPWPGRADVLPGAYVGSSKTTVKYLNPTTLAVVATESYARKAKVTIAPPKVSETNPFAFGIAPFPRTDLASAGDVFAASARIINVL